MPAAVKYLRWPAIVAAGRLNSIPRFDRAGRIAAHVVGWPLLLKVGLFLGIALAAAVRHVLAA